MKLKVPFIENASLLKTASRIMRYSVLLLVAVLVLNSCKKENTTVPELQTNSVTNGQATVTDPHKNGPQARLTGSTVYFRGHYYYVDVVPSGRTAVVYLRWSYGMCSIYDITAMSLSASTPTLGSVKSTICRAKTYYDSYKTVAGCLSVVASGACGGAAVASDGAAAVLCTATWNYAVSTGLGDCVDGVTAAIGNALGMNEWATLATTASISTVKWSSIISTAVDQACRDAR